MLSVADAQRIVFEHVQPLRPRAQPVAPEVLGLILGEDVASDLDLPPFDKAMMDGYAVRAADFADGIGTFEVIEEVSAGRTPTKPVQAGQATRIMTGAPIPDGADAVVMIERSQMQDDGRVRMEEPRVRPELNVLRRGREMRQGETILTAGMRLRPEEVGLLSAVGRAIVQVRPAPRVAVLPTGDEIVEVWQKPGPGQIRNSNGPMILAQVARAGGVPHWLGIARDTQQSLRMFVEEGLQDTVLVLSGGVSAGKLDLVPSVLAEMGVHPLFHKIEMKPGKPLLFGIKPHDDRPPTLVFGLPGNPVSSLVCFELFVRPAIQLLKGLPSGPTIVSAKLVEEFVYRTDRPTYHPAILEGDRVRMIPWFGSPDLRGVAPGNSFAIIPPGDHRFAAGDGLSVLVM